MCYSTFSSSSQAKLKKRFGVSYASEPEEVAPKGQLSGFDHPRLPLITSQATDQIQYLEWGLIPAWASAEQAKTLVNQTLNAKTETVFEKPSFRDAILTQRCLVLVDGFFEWQHVGKQKMKYFIHLQDGEPFALGGIWSVWQDPVLQRPRHTFSILTTEANPLMAEIHNVKKRMPLILSRETEWEWLNVSLPKAHVQSLMIPFDEHLMKAEMADPKPMQLGLF
ncbi:MAG: SOS response-associated peptidase [Spirosomataceae bacterium]